MKGFLFLILIIKCIQFSSNFMLTPSLIEEERINSTKFTIDFYRALFDETRNTIASPISFRILLSFLYQTSTGLSELELMEKVYLSNDKNVAEISQNQNLRNFMENRNIKILNKIYIKNNVSLRRDLISATESYQISIEQVDFSHKRETTDKVNHWVERETHGLIQRLVTEGVFSHDMSLFLMNTLYFKAQWKHPFSASAVYESEFIDIDGIIQTINIMSTSDIYKVSQFDKLKASIIEIPYITHSNFVFWILLPNENSHIVELQESFSYNMLHEINKSFQEISIELSLPIFDIGTSIDGIQVLRKLGLSAIFENYDINMLENHDFLKVNAAKQKCRIIVNTDGTEASSASYIEFIIRSGKPFFYVNRPFIYMILTADTKEPIFIGHFSKPT